MKTKENKQYVDDTLYVIDGVMHNKKEYDDVEEQYRWHDTRQLVFIKEYRVIIKRKKRTVQEYEIMTDGQYSDYVNGLRE